MARMERELEARRDPERARYMEAYLRGQFSFYGVPAPGQRDALRAALTGLGPFDEASLREISRAAWERDEREWQHIACAVLRRGVPGCGAGFLSTLEHLIATKSWWDTVDTLAAHSVGALVSAHRRLGAEMDRWIESSDFWLARSAILHQLGYKARTDADRLFAYCTQRAPDKEFFIRKAIGWALREYSKTDPDGVASFVAAHQDELSGLSKREALKRLAR
jgi:3-methyladenine DNA glycosylase AlkD